MRIALTIAGSDSGGGAGIQADLKTFAAHSVFGTSAITAVTAQNTTGVTAALALPPELVVSQIDAVVTDLGTDAVKIGMLSNIAIIEAVVGAITRHGLTPVVLDTVMVSKGGARLLDEDAVGALADHLLPLASVATPNAAEAATLTGRPVTTRDEQRSAAKAIVAMGAKAVVVKGGHVDLDGPSVDVFFDGRSFVELRAERHPGRHTHGTGCTFSAAIAAQLALGATLDVAVHAAKDYVTRAILQAPGLGHGHGPLRH